MNINTGNNRGKQYRSINEVLRDYYPDEYRKPGYIINTMHEKNLGKRLVKKYLEQFEDKNKKSK